MPALFLALFLIGLYPLLRAWWANRQTSLLQALNWVLAARRRLELRRPRPARRHAVAAGRDHRRRRAFSGFAARAVSQRDARGRGAELFADASGAGSGAYCIRLHRGDHVARGAGDVSRAVPGRAHLTPVPGAGALGWVRRL